MNQDAYINELRGALIQSRDANCVCAYGATQADAVERANRVLGLLPGAQGTNSENAPVLTKYRVLYNASDDENAPDWRDDGIFLMAVSADAARGLAFNNPHVKGSEVVVFQEPATEPAVNDTALLNWLEENNGRLQFEAEDEATPPHAVVYLPTLEDGESRWREAGRGVDFRAAIADAMGKDAERMFARAEAEPKGAEEKQ